MHCSRWECRRVSCVVCLIREAHQGPSFGRSLAGSWSARADLRAGGGLAAPGAGPSLPQPCRGADPRPHTPAQDHSDHSTSFVLWSPDVGVAGSADSALGGGGGHRRCKPSSLARAKNAFGTDGHVPHLGHPIQEPLATSGCWPPGTWLGPLRNSAFPLIYLSLGVNSSAVLCGVACRSWPWKVSTVPRPPPAGLCPAPCTPPAPKMNHSRQWQFSDYSFFFFLFL